MKKLLSLAAFAAVALAACGGAAAKTTPAPTAAPTTEAPTTTAPTPTTTVPKATGGDITACSAISNAYEEAGPFARQWVKTSATPGEVSITVSPLSFWNQQKPAFNAVSVAAASIDDPTLATGVAKLTNILRDDLYQASEAKDEHTFPNAVWAWMKNADTYMKLIDHQCTTLGVQQDTYPLIDPTLLHGS